MEQRTPQLRRDLLLAAVLLVPGVILLGVLFFRGDSGNTVTVRVGGEAVASFPLEQDTEYRIEGADGGTNLLVIEYGTARISQADCPDGLCVGMGRIRRAGQSIVCLPHQVIVEVEGGEGEGVDAVAR